MDTKHWRLCDSVSALNHLHRCHIHFITTSSCSASVLMGREKKLSLADVQSWDNNKTGHWSEKLSRCIHCGRHTNAVPSGGNQMDRQTAMPTAELAHNKQVTPCGIQDFCIQSHLSWIPQSTGRSRCTGTAQLVAATLPETWIKCPWPAIPEISRAELGTSNNPPLVYKRVRKYQVISSY